MGLLFAGESPFLDSNSARHVCPRDKWRDTRTLSLSLSLFPSFLLLHISSFHSFIPFPPLYFRRYFKVALQPRHDERGVTRRDNIAQSPPPSSFSPPHLLLLLFSTPLTRSLSRLVSSRLSFPGNGIFYPPLPLPLGSFGERGREGGGGESLGNGTAAGHQYRTRVYHPLRIFHFNIFPTFEPPLRRV